MMHPAQLLIRKMEYSDYENMAQWLSTKEVLEFYGNVNSPLTLERVIEKYEPRIRGEVLIVPYIVELDRVPVGYVQQYVLSEAAKREYGYSADLKIYGIDQFIGIPNLFNRGLGTAMVRKFMDFLYRTSNLDMRGP